METKWQASLPNPGVSFESLEGKGSGVQNFETRQFLLKSKLISGQEKILGTCWIFPPSLLSSSLFILLPFFLLLPTSWAPSLISLSPLIVHQEHSIETRALRSHFHLAGEAVGSRVFMKILNSSLVTELNKVLLQVKTLET